MCVREKKLVWGCGSAPAKTIKKVKRATQVTFSRIIVFHARVPDKYTAEEANICSTPLFASTIYKLNRPFFVT